MSEHCLTEDEIKIVKLLAEARAIFNGLPSRHPSDVRDFEVNIHVLQRHVMARLARRVHAEVFGPTAG